MQPFREKRLLTRIVVPDLNGRLELDGNHRGVYVLDATEDGVCVGGTPIPVGDVVLLSFEHPGMDSEIALYAKAVWTSDDNKEKRSGLSFLHTNKILFKDELLAFSRLIADIRTSLN